MKSIRQSSHQTRVVKPFLNCVIECHIPVSEYTYLIEI